MREKYKKRLGEILVEDGVITPESVTEALDHQKKEGGMIGQILIRLGYITEENLLAALGKQLNIPYIPLMNYSINSEAIKRFSDEYCRKNMVVCFDEDEKRIYLAVSDPLNVQVIDDIEKETKKRAQVFLSMPSEIHQVLDMIFNMGSSKKEIKKAG